MEKYESRAWQFFAMLILLQCWSRTVNAQVVNLDKPMLAGDLTVYPDIRDENSYYYLVDQVQLARNADGTPQIQLLQYVNDADGSEEKVGIFHAVVQFKTTKEQLEMAQQTLSRTKPNASIKGYVGYKSGTMGLVSSFGNPEGDLTTQVIGLGSAPILEGHKGAVSIELTQKGTEILFGSMQSQLPDLSFAFEMEYDGYREPQQAIIEYDFKKIYKHKDFDLGIASAKFGAEIQATFEELRRDGAIKITQYGGDEKMDEMITTAYNKLLEMMFEKVETSEAGERATEEQEGALDMATELYNTSRAEAIEYNQGVRERRAAEQRRREAEEARRREREEGATASAETGEEANNRPGHMMNAVRPSDNLTYASAPAFSAGGLDDELMEVPKVAVITRFRMKNIKREDKFRLDLKKSGIETRRAQFVFNPSKLEEPDKAITTIYASDNPINKVQRIYASLDKIKNSDFDDYLNFVSLEVRKNHQDGTESIIQPKVVDKAVYNEETNSFELKYRWKEDDQIELWDKYKYQVNWSFHGGNEVLGEWIETEQKQLTLAPPINRKIINLTGEKETLTSNNVRSVDVRIYYDWFGTEKTKQVTINTKSNTVAERLEILLPEGRNEYEYEITWRIKGNEEKKSGRKHSDYGELYIDEL